MTEKIPDILEKVKGLNWSELLLALGGNGLTGYFGQALDNFRERSTGTIYIKCVFHEERTASMVLRPSGSFHCYGCGSEGDKASFVGLIAAGPTMTERKSPFPDNSLLEYVIEAAQQRIALHPDQMQLEV
jgi:hypothetical protein